MIWDCGVCNLPWDSKDEAEWCCSQECEEATAHFAAMKEKAEENKRAGTVEFPGFVY